MSKTSLYQYQTSLSDLLDELQQKMEPEEFQAALKNLIHFLKYCTFVDDYDGLAEPDASKWFPEKHNGIFVWRVTYPYKQELHAIAEIILKARLTANLNLVEESLRNTLEDKLDATLDPEKRKGLSPDRRSLPAKYKKDQQDILDYYNRKIRINLAEIKEIVGVTNLKTLIRGIMPYYLSQERETSSRCKNRLDETFLAELGHLGEKATTLYHYLISNLESLHQSSLTHNDFTHLNELSNLYLQSSVQTDTQENKISPKRSPHGCSVYNLFYHSDLDALIHSRPPTNSWDEILAPRDDVVLNRGSLLAESDINPVITGVCTTIALVLVMFKIPKALAWIGQTQHRERQPEPQQEVQHTIR